MYNEIDTVVGVSIGTVIGLLYVIDYNWEDLQNDIIGQDLKKLTDIKITNLIRYYGLDSCSKIINWLGDLLTKRGYSKDITLIDLNKKTGKFLQILTTRLKNYSLFSFDHKSTPNIKVIDAIRLAISIPIIFTCVRYISEIYVDAALINNCPVEYVKEQNKLECTDIFCINLNSKNIEKDIDSFSDYIKEIMTCFLYNKNNQPVSSKNILEIDTGGKGTVDFNITNERKGELIELGYNSMNKWVNDYL